jgi:hypothetical protein
MSKMENENRTGIAALVVSAIIDNSTFDGGPVRISLTKDGVEIVLNRKDWEELTAVLNRKRIVLDPALVENEYIPRLSIVYNLPQHE